MKKNLFARICRTLGRFLLALGTVFCIAEAAIALSPILLPSESNNPSTGGNPSSNNSFILAPEPGVIEHSNLDLAALGVLGAVIGIAIIIIFALVMRSYNGSIRRIIAKTANFCHLQIHTTELILATLAWLIVTIGVFLTTPLNAILVLPVLIINDLLFVFAWVAYGCPEYTL